MSRKGHIGYYSGREVVPFPRVRTLGELGAQARSAGATYLYYSWYETQLRPEFAYLLDTTSAIPGLSAVYVSGGKPAVLYRIGPEFGRSPEWLADPFEHSVHLARGVVLARGEEAPSVHHAALALDALLRGRWSESIAHAHNATRRNPDDAVSWTVAGEGLRRLGRDAEARGAFVRATALDPTDPTALIGLGKLERAAGDRGRATRYWQAAAARAQHGPVQAEIHRLLQQVADSSDTRHH
jgi:tetratricopeptide (TPR) repeat protein